MELFLAATRTRASRSSNLTDELKQRGLKTPDGIEKLWNIEGSLGGPIKKDKVWFFGSARAFHLNTLPADAFVGIPGTERRPCADSKQRTGVDPQKINSFQGRIVWQISQKTKLSAYNDRILKDRGADQIAGVDPATASGVWKSPIYTTGSVKVASTISNRILVEGGFSANLERYTILAQPGITKERGTPEWYTQIFSRTFHSARTGARTEAEPDGFPIGCSPAPSPTSPAPTTSRWACKTRLAAIAARTRSTVTFTRSSWPVWLRCADHERACRALRRLHADLGVYPQDSWTMNHLTINYGARFEHFAHGIPVETSPAGRFTAARTFGPIDMPTWNSVSPAAAWSTTSSATRRRLRNSASASTCRLVRRVSPRATTRCSSRRPTSPGPTPTATASPGRARLHLPAARLEINLAQLPTGFGVASLANFDPDIKRMYNVETARQRAARAAAAGLGHRRLVPPRLPQPAAPRQHAAVLLGLHAVHALQPDRRLARLPTTT